MGLCEQLLSHLSKYQQQDKENPSISSKEPSTSDAAIPFEGMKAVKKPDTSDGFEGLQLKNASVVDQDLTCSKAPDELIRQNLEGCGQA